MKLAPLILLLSFAMSAPGQPATCVPVPPRLVGWWRGEGDATDSAGTNNGTLRNGAGFAPGEVGSAFTFDASTGYVEVPDNDLWAFGTDSFTIELWANWNAAPQGYSVFVGNDEGVPGRKWIFSLVSDLLEFTVQNPPASPVFLVRAPLTPSLNQWYHLAVVRNGNVFTIFLNGVAVGSEANSITIGNANAPLTIGQAEGLGYFQGKLDEVSIYNRALAPNEIAAIYNAGSAGKCRPPTIISQPQGQVGYWGRSVTFSVTASGSAPLGYLWYKDGFAIAWATNSSLVLTNLALDAGGNYSVVVSNALGSVISSNAFLTINPAGVSLGLYAGLTVEGTVGNMYGIQYATNITPTTTWTTLTQITLAQPVQLWVDTNVNVAAGDNPRRFYRVVAIP
jgi:hypothetical protein